MTHAEIDAQFDLLISSTLDRARQLECDEPSIGRMWAIAEAGRELAKAMIWTPPLAASFHLEYRQILDLVGKGCSMSVFLGRLEQPPEPYPLASWDDDGHQVAS